MITRMTDYEVLDGGTVRVHFTSPDPAPYSQSDFYVQITSAEANQNQAQLRTLLTTRLQEKYGTTLLLEDGTLRSQGITSLNTFKGQTITVNT